MAINLDNRPYFKIGIESIKKYAEKIKTDLVIKYYSELENCIFEKFFIKDLLKIYDRVLWIDADILIKENADDLFKIYPDSSQVYIHPETDRFEIDYNIYIDEVIKFNKVNWVKDKGKYVYYNNGIFLVSRGQEKIFTDSQIKTKSLLYLIEQTTMNYNIFKYNIPVSSLDIKYNAMRYFNESGQFIHYANISNRFKLMESEK
jgi:lipopolysaccharide biosynthesis glycosyltransferase